MISEDMTLHINGLTDEVRFHAKMTVQGMAIQTFPM
jgi:hypothetical protein